MLDRKCLYCAHYEPVDPEVGICRRYAPRPSIMEWDEAPVIWPETSPLDWCGEFDRVRANELERRKREQ